MSQCSPCSFFFPQLYMLSLTSYGMEYPFGQVGQLSWLYPLPASYALPAFSLASQYDKLKSLWLLRNNSKHQCAINIILIPNPKHSTTPTTRKKINSIPAETRTELSRTLVLCQMLNTATCASSHCTAIKLKKSNLLGSASYLVSLSSLCDRYFWLQGFKKSTCHPSAVLISLCFGG